MFDPYGQWLGIPEEERPITSHRLLGISPKEADPRTIVLAAVTQAQRVRQHQQGPHAEMCARLLKEIDRAKATLLNPSEPRESAVAESGEAAGSDDERGESEDVGTKPSGKKGKGSGRRGDKKKSSAAPWLVIGIVGAVLLLPLLIGGGIAAYLIFGRSSKPARAVASSAATSQPPAQAELPNTTRQEPDPFKAIPKLEIPIPKPAAPVIAAPNVALIPPPTIAQPFPPQASKPPDTVPGAPITSNIPPDSPKPAPIQAPKSPAEKPAMPASPTMPGTTPKQPTEFNGISLKEWVKRLKDPDPSTRDAALRVVPNFGDQAREHIPTMISMMVNDPDVAVRVTAMLVVTTTTLDKPDQIKQVVTNLNTLMLSAHGSIKFQAMAAASRMGIDAQGAIPKLIDLLKDPSSYQIRAAAAVALGQVGRGAKPVEFQNPQTGPDRRAVHALTDSMDEKALVVRMESVRALINLGPPALPDDWEAEKKTVLGRIQREPDPVVKLWLRVLFMRLSNTLEKAQFDANMVAISKELSNPAMRIAAAQALGTVGKEAASQINGLLSGLKDDKPENLPYMAMCLWALGQMGTDAAAATFEVTRLTTHANEGIRVQARNTLERLQGKKR